MCKRDRSKAWKKYCDVTKSQKDISRLAKIAQQLENKVINVFDKPDGSCTDPGLETLDHLIKTHFPKSTQMKRIIYDSLINVNKNVVDNEYSDWINADLVKTALGDFEAKKSPGPDLSLIHI